MSDSAGNKKRVNGSGGLAIGIAIGVALGVAMDNIAVGVGIGVALGLTLGGTQRRKKRCVDHSDQDDPGVNSPSG